VLASRESVKNFPLAVWWRPRALQVEEAGKKKTRMISHNYFLVVVECI